MSCRYKKKEERKKIYFIVWQKLIQHVKQLYSSRKKERTYNGKESGKEYVCVCIIFFCCISKTNKILYINPGLPHCRWFFTIWGTREAHFNDTSIQKKKKKENVFYPLVMKILRIYSLNNFQISITEDTCYKLFLKSQ